MEKRTALPDYKLISNLKAEPPKETSNCENQSLEFYKSELENVYKLLSSFIDANLVLVNQVDCLTAENVHLMEQVKQLESRLNMNSKNSSRPPSTDEFIKPVSLRKKSGKRPGGHKGNTLKMSNTPDDIVIHGVKACCKCGHSLEGITARSVERRQVFDIPSQKIFVTEHQAHSKDCPFCASKNKASFPENVTQNTQYGDNLKAVVVYLNQYSDDTLQAYN